MNRSNPQNGERPTFGLAELEARIVVLEIVSMTALALAMDTSENSDIEHARGISSLILDTVRQRCDELEMPDKARLSACSYADELLSTALISLYPQGQ